MRLATCMFPFAMLVPTMTACGGSGTDGPQDGETDGETDGPDPCTLEPVCTPYEWSCDGDGLPVECLASGDGWQDREACPAGQSCDPATGWCSCGPCEVDVDGTCERVGAACETGWEDDGACGCVPVRDACGESEIPLLGGGCAHVGPVDDCGPDTWGHVATGPDTVYVDISYAGSDADGTRERPFTTIQAAVDAVPATGGPHTVAVAAGRYTEAVRVDSDVTVAGRCPSMVTIAPAAGLDWGVRLGATGSGLEGVTVDCRAGIHTCVRIDEAADVTVRDIVVDSAIDAGIYGHESTFTVTDVAVRDVAMSWVSDYAYGIAGFSSDGMGCSITVEGADVDSVRRLGLFSNSCETEMRRNRVTRAGESGIRARSGTGPHSVLVAENLIEDCTVGGIATLEVDGVFPSIEITGNTVRGTVFSPYWTDGTQTSMSIQSAAGDITISGNVVESSEVGAIAVFSETGRVDVTGNLVREVQDRGIEIQNAGSGLIEGNTCRDVVQVGLRAAHGSSVVMESNTVRGVAVGGVAAGSRGVDCSDHHGCTIRGSVIADAEEGVIVLESSGDVTVERNLLDVSRAGVFVLEHVGGGACLVNENRVISGAAGIGIWAAPSLAVEAASNRIGPLDGYISSEGDVPVRYGLLVDSVGSVALDGDLVDMGSPAVGDVWGLGLHVVDSCGSVTGSRVRGAWTLGIMFADHFGTTCGDVGVTQNVITSGAGVGIFFHRAHSTGGSTIAGNSIASIEERAWPDGKLFGDGLAVVDTRLSSPVTISTGSLVESERVGLFVSNSLVEASDLDVRSNAVSMAWQDAAEVTLATNEVTCNGSDQPWVEQGLEVPDAPTFSMPEP